MPATIQTVFGPHTHNHYLEIKHWTPVCLITPYHVMPKALGLMAGYIAKKCTAHIIPMHQVQHHPLLPCSS